MTELDPRALESAIAAVGYGRFCYGPFGCEENVDTKSCAPCKEQAERISRIAISAYLNALGLVSIPIVKPEDVKK